MNSVRENSAKNIVSLISEGGNYMNAYKKEVWFTIIFTILFLFSGHLGLFFSIFPVEGNLLGFPIMYIVPILSGWFGVLFLVIVAGKIGNQIDDDIEKENQDNSKIRGEGVV